MATITGLTAARMQEIVDATIVGANVVDNHLILIKEDDSEIDAGLLSTDADSVGFDPSPSDLVSINVGDALRELAGITDVVGGPISAEELYFEETPLAMTGTFVTASEISPIDQSLVIAAFWLHVGATKVSTITTGVTGSVSEVHHVWIDAISGRHKLTWNGQQTGFLNFNDGPATWQAALEALSNIAPGDVTVTGGVGNNGATAHYILTWDNALGNVSAPTVQNIDLVTPIDQHIPVGLTGCGLDWELLTLVRSNEGSDKGQFFYIGQGEAVSDQLSLEMFPTGTTGYVVSAHIVEAVNVFVGDSPRDAIRQFKMDHSTGNGTAWTYYMEPMADPQNYALGMAIHGAGDNNATVEAGWDLISTTNGTTPGARPGDNISFIAYGALGTTDTSATVTWSPTNISNEGLLFELVSINTDPDSDGWAPVFHMAGDIYANATVPIEWPYESQLGLLLGYDDVVGFLVVEVRDSDTFDVSGLQADGWELVSASLGDGTGGTGTRRIVLWKRQDVLAEPGLTLTTPGDHLAAAIFTVRNCAEDPIEVTAASIKAAASTVTAVPGVDTETPNTHVVYIASRAFDVSGAQYSDETNASLDGLYERLDGGTSTGTGGGFGVWSGTLAADGPSGTLAATLANSTTEVYLSFAIAGIPGSSTPVGPEGEFIRDIIGLALVGGINIDVIVNDAGDVITIDVAGVALSPDRQVFTASGTWTKPAGTYTIVDILCIGGGAGGGGGRQGAAASIRSGGGGGGGGGLTQVSMPFSAVDASCAVVVGTAGIGGIAATAPDTNGGAGGNGVGSSFAAVAGSSVTAGGGIGGGGGDADGVPASVFSGLFAAFAPSEGGASSATGAAGSAGGTSRYAGAGGAGGGGITTGNVAAAGGAGGAVGSRGAASATAGAVSGGAGAAGSSAPANTGLPGSGGGGGAGHAAGVGGAGGAGGIYGGGGGGGGASLNGNNSGVGGAGAGGIVVVVCR